MTVKVLPQKQLPTEYDAMENHTSLINRAIAMHLLREGQFDVASTFLRESTDHPHQLTANSSSTSRDPGAGAASPLNPDDLQDSFSNMYTILYALKERDLMPAITWAHKNSVELELRGSNLEFELTRLQFVWLFKGMGANGASDSEGREAALAYARQAFGRFQGRHLKEIQQLSCAMIYASNIAHSPYHLIFETDAAFDEVSTSFTREFCSLLGLSAESPLYVAATAGAIALPQLIKYTTHAKAKKTEWTTENELAFATPLPRSMVYHPIFVCPVSKEHTTDANPPMMLTCGHVVCKDSLTRLTKGGRFKCPYCPSEGQHRDAREIIL